jgi:hypothetical protein
MGLRSGGYEACCCSCVVGGCWIICYDDEMEDTNPHLDSQLYRRLGTKLDVLLLRHVLYQKRW